MVSLVDAMQKGVVSADPVLVISNRPRTLGIEKANARKIDAHVVDHKEFATRQEFETAVLEKITQASIDIICLAGFMRVLSAKFISDFKGTILNIHPSLLPKYKGLNTHQRALDAGDSIAGCSVHIVTPELDDGPIIAQTEVPILPMDTAQSLAERILIEEHKLYPHALQTVIDQGRNG